MRHRPGWRERQEPGRVVREEAREQSPPTPPHTVHGPGMFERNMPEEEALRVPQPASVWSPKMSWRKRIAKLKSMH